MMTCVCPKQANGCQLCNFSGFLSPPPLTDQGQICHTRVAPDSTLTCQIWSKLVYSVAHGVQKTPNFAQFLAFTCSGGATWRRTEKVERRCTTTNLPLSNDIKIVSILQRYLDEVVSTNYVVQQRDGQTDKQTKNSTFLPPLAAREVRAPPNLAW